MQPTFEIFSQNWLLNNVFCEVFGLFLPPPHRPEKLLAAQLEPDGPAVRA